MHANEIEFHFFNFTNFKIFYRILTNFNRFTNFKEWNLLSNTQFRNGSNECDKN